MRIGILTGGGDAPGLNGIIESSSRVLLQNNAEMIGICDGFEGVFEGRTKKIHSDSIRGLHAEAGTFLGTSNRSRIDGRENEFVAAYKNLRLDGLIAAGGDGTFSALAKVSQHIPLIGVPKTIDNDLPGTELTFGFDTACAVVADSADALRASAEAHRRIMIIETMGRTAGWIALGGGLASLADAILIPERPFEKKSLMDFIHKKKSAGCRGLVIVCSEAAHAQGAEAITTRSAREYFQSERFRDVSEHLARLIEKECDWECRNVVLGHLQRSRAPTTTDRFLTASLGVKAASLALERAWNQAVVYREGGIKAVPIKEIQGSPRRVAADHHWIQLAQSLGIFI